MPEVPIASGKTDDGFTFSFVRSLAPGEKWRPHPAGGVIITHSDRPPMRCWMEEGVWRQDWIEPDAGEVRCVTL